MTTGLRQNIGLIIILAYFAFAFLMVRPIKPDQSKDSKESK